MGNERTDDPGQVRRGEDSADIIVITGMSGAGRTEAMHTFEDLGYYAIDNLPPELIGDLARVVGIGSETDRRLAVVCDLRSQGLFDDLLTTLEGLSREGFTYTIVFLDASDDALLRRFSERRRRHPIAAEGEPTASAIKRERAQLADVHDHADVVIDTTDLRSSQLRAKLRDQFSEVPDQQLMEVHVFSFGFKYGRPVEADLLVDVRFLPNPFYDPEMRHLTGKDEKVRDFVLGRTETQGFLDAWHALLDVVMPGYVAEGKSVLSIAMGCTGGQHRSVVLADATGEYLSQLGYRVTVSHRDLPRARR